MFVKISAKLVRLTSSAFMRFSGVVFRGFKMGTLARDESINEVFR